MDLDILEHLLGSMNDAAVLAKFSGVCRQWRLLASGDRIWEALASKRWMMSTINNRCVQGSLSMGGGHFWKRMYAQWHKQGRQPSSNYSGERFPAFATNASREKAKRLERFYGKKATPQQGAGGGPAFNVGLWANVSHSHDCALAEHSSEEGVHNMLALSVVVQNFGDVPVRVRPEDLCLHRKDEAVVRPILEPSPASSDDEGAIQRSRGGLGVQALGRGGRLNEDSVDGEDGIVLAQWDFAVLGVCLFAMESTVTHEPLALECCRDLSLLVRSLA
ncbi:hypothetical protein T484DRAFT_1772874 [Baffinella frigidus]|nr:hypothetical protein T484DRAFT_1772874 [Cryptophyta sp. CCMP2293]